MKSDQESDALTICENIAADYRLKAEDAKLGSVARVRNRQRAIGAEECANTIRAALGMSGLDPIRSSDGEVKGG
jgi:hypothetical protein